MVEVSKIKVTERPHGVWLTLKSKTLFLTDTTVEMLLLCSDNVSANHYHLTKEMSEFLIKKGCEIEFKKLVMKHDNETK